MNLTIEISDDLGVALQAHANAQGISADSYVSRILEHTFASEVGAESTRRPFETGYGSWAKYGPGPSAEEIDENRRDMFQNFAQDFR